MRFRVLVIIVMAFASTALLLFGIVLFKGQPSVASKIKKTEMIVGAASALPAGTLLQPGQLHGVPVAISKVPLGAIPDTPANQSSLVGGMVRHGLAAGSAITERNIIRPGDHGFLAAVLHPGMRAITIGVDATSDSAGLIWPGDYVGVLLTQTITNNGKTQMGHQMAVEIVLRDVQVIATGQNIVQTGPRAAKVAPTVTLEVTQLQAEKLAMAEHLGPLSVIVHSAKRDLRPQDKPSGPLWAGTVSPALQSATQGSRKTIQVFPGASASQSFDF